MKKLEKIGVIIFIPSFYEKMKKTSADFFNYLKSAVKNEIEVREIFKQDMSPWYKIKKNDDASKRGRVVFDITNKNGDTVTVIEFHKSGRIIATTCGELTDDFAIEIGLFDRSSKGIEVKVAPGMTNMLNYIKCPRNEVFRLDFMRNNYQLAGVRITEFIVHFINCGNELLESIKIITGVLATAHKRFMNDIEAELAREAEFKNFV